MAINKPSIVDLLRKVDSRYTLAIVAAKRARQLIANEAQPLIDPDELKPLKIAIEEINRNLITYSKPYSKEEY
ncbi:MAG: DNA-directed RNA polymerase subunit omega [Christensenellaceae bacterium]|nr:DNA-directed RNA polymerase subunit omega [Christensenellaceae bacterium]